MQTPAPVLAVVPTSDILRIAADSETCVPTVRARLAGKRIRGRAGERLERVLISRGIVSAEQTGASCRGGPQPEEMRSPAP